MSLERYAALSAIIDTFGGRDEVLARADLAPADWSDQQKLWLKRMAKEARHMRFDLQDRYNTLFLELRATLEQGESVDDIAFGLPEQIEPADNGQQLPSNLVAPAAPPPAQPVLPARVNTPSQPVAAGPSPWAGAPRAPAGAAPTGVGARKRARYPTSLPFQAVAAAAVGGSHGARAKRTRNDGALPFAPPPLAAPVPSQPPEPSAAAAPRAGLPFAAHPAPARRSEPSLQGLPFEPVERSDDDGPPSSAPGPLSSTLEEERGAVGEALPFERTPRPARTSSPPKSDDGALPFQARGKSQLRAESQAAEVGPSPEQYDGDLFETVEDDDELSVPVAALPFAPVADKAPQDRGVSAAGKAALPFAQAASKARQIPAMPSKAGNAALPFVQAAGKNPSARPKSAASRAGLPFAAANPPGDPSSPAAPMPAGPILPKVSTGTVVAQIDPEMLQRLAEAEAAAKAASSGGGVVSPQPRGPSLTLEQFASITAEIAVAPAQSSNIEERYGFDPEGYVREKQAWADRFGTSPDDSARYAKLVREYRDWLKRDDDGAG